jgi:hypothetical protein
MKTTDMTYRDSDSQFQSGMRYRIEIGNCAMSEYSFTDNEAEARKELDDMINRWENSGIPECMGDAIEIAKIDRMSADEDGDYCTRLDKEI